MSMNHTYVQCHLNAWFPAAETKPLIVHYNIFFQYKKTLWKKSWLRNQSHNRQPKTEFNINSILLNKEKRFISSTADNIKWLTEESSPFPSFIQDSQLLKMFSPCLKKDLSGFLNARKDLSGFDSLKYQQTSLQCSDQFTCSQTVKCLLVFFSNTVTTVSLPQKPPKLCQLLKLKLDSSNLSIQMPASSKVEILNNFHPPTGNGVICLGLGNPTTICWSLFS